MNVLRAYLGYVVSSIGVGFIGLLSLECRRLARRVAKAEAKVAQLSREAGALNDDLLQSIQGFVLTFYAVTQNVTCDQTVKQTIDQAFLTADRAVVDGRNRFERLRLRPVGKDLGDKDSGQNATLPREGTKRCTQ